MGHEKGSSSPFAFLSTLRPEHLLAVVLLIITAAFVVSYARLFYEYRQAQAEKARVASLVAEEETRRKDLEVLESLTQQEGFRQAESARIFSPTSRDGNNQQAAGAAPGEVRPAQERTEGKPRSPVWREWLRLFHLAPSGGAEKTTD